MFEYSPLNLTINLFVKYNCFLFLKLLQPRHFDIRIFVLKYSKESSINRKCDSFGTYHIYISELCWNFYITKFYLYFGENILFALKQ